MRLKSLFFAIGMLFCTVLSAQQTKTTAYTVADEGAWCWFADPRALHYENANGTINATYIGYIDYHGSIKATQVDWTTNTTQEVLVRSWFQPDDHDNPAFLVLPDERVMIIYSRHTDEACFYYRISKRPGDITQLGEEKRLATANNTTYPNPFILSDDPEHIYMCWRGIGWHPTVAQMSMPDANDDIKFTWGPYQMVQSTGARPYAKYISNGKDKIYLAYTTGHPDNEYPNWLYCNVFNVNDKCLYDIKGKKLSTVQNGKFAVNKTDSYKSSYPNTIVDATADRRDWLWNMAFDGKGNPVIGMTKINNGKTSHDYYYAKWNGSSWQTAFIVNGGGQFHQTNGVEMCYSGGMAVDRDNPQDVYCSVPVNGVYEIVKYTMSEDGKTVVANEAVTSNSKLNNARPFVIEGTGKDDLRLTWMNGNYYYWIVNTTYKNAYPTSIIANKPLPVTTSETAGSSLSIDLTIKPESYVGEHLTLTGNNGAATIIYGVNSDQHSYVKVNGKTFTSQNVLGTADSWQTENTGTTGGTWLNKTKLGRHNLTMTCDGKMLTIYVNGVIDQKIDCDVILQKITSSAQSVTIHNEQPYNSCISQAKVKQIITENEMTAISIPATISTDIVLPASTASGKTIAWTSSNESILSNAGIVTLPKKASEVTLTATVGEQTKSFTVTVQPRNLSNNLRASFLFDGNDKGITLKGSAKLTNGKLDLTSNTASGFNTNGYAVVDAGLLDGLRSYTVLITATPKSLTNAPRLYDFGGGSGNSLFLRANALSAGIKYNGGTTTMVNGATALANGKEYKLAVTFDAATKTTKIYVNGEEDASGTANINEPYMIYQSSGDARNYIGRTQWWDGSYASSNVDFVGTIDNVYIYDIALTQKEVCDAQSIPFQEKEYASEIVNTDFEGSYSVLSGSGVSKDRAIYVPEGWTVDYSARNENDFNAMQNGDLYYSQFFASKPQNSEGGKHTMWIRQRWGSSSLSFYQEVKLPAGTYTLTADILSSDTKSGSYVFVNNQKKVVKTANTWEKAQFDFESDGDEVFRIGLQSIHTDADGERICAFDNFVLTQTSTAIVNREQNSVLPVAYYTLSGIRTSALRKGVNIVRFSDGTSRKIIIE